MAKKEKLLERAQKFIQKGYLDKAIGEYLQIVEMDSNDISTRLRLGDLYVKTSNKEAAITEYLDVAKINTRKGFYLKAIAVYKQILKLDDGILDIHYKLADLYTKQRLNADAISSYSVIISNFEKKGKIKESLELLQKMVEIDPENVGVRLKLADMHKRLGFNKDAAVEYMWVFDKLFGQDKLDKAEKICHGAYRLSPDEIVVLEGLTKLCRKKGDDTGFVEYGVKLAAIYKENDQSEKAIAICKDVVEVHPGSQKALSILSEFKVEVVPKAAEETEVEEEAGVEERGVEDEAAEGQEAPSPPDVSEEAVVGVEAEVGPEGKVVGEGEGEKSKQAPEVETKGVTEEVESPGVAPDEGEDEFVEVEVPGDEAGEAGKTEGDVRKEAPGEVQELEGVEAVEEVEAEAEELPADEVTARPVETVEEAGGIEPESAEVEEIEELETVDEVEEVEEFEELEEIEAVESVEAGPEPGAGDIDGLIPEGMLEEVAGGISGDVEEISTDDLASEFLEVESTIEEPVKAEEEEFVDLSRELGLEEAIDSLVQPWMEGESGEAVQEFKEGLGKQLSKEDTETHFNLGIAYMEMELHDDAIREFKIALKDPFFEFNSYTRLGLCSMSLGNYDGAIEYYFKALKVRGSTDDERKGIMYEIGLAYEAAGKMHDAGEMFGSVYDMDADYREVSEKVKLQEASMALIPKDDHLIEVELL